MRLVVYPSLILIVTHQGAGEHCFDLVIRIRSSSRIQRILEYLSRDDADHAVKDLDGKELRGQAVRVTLAEDVRSIIHVSLT